MQLISGGPDIPPEVIQALEDEELVIICGAGISANNGLPLFDGLVQKVIDKKGAAGKADVMDAFRSKAYDRALGRLEFHYGEKEVRRIVQEELKIPKRPKYRTHRAILDLSQTVDGRLRLVTTNFDLLFERARKKLPSCAAPTLPVPKKSKWNALVYLHGRIDKEYDPDGLHLVLTSADFGTAYLVERWASRFICELFNHFTVLFIGYRVGDPVMRYLMDALAVERKSDGRIREAYAFANYGKEPEVDVKNSWRVKNVIPVLYNEAKRHRGLHETLVKWAEIWTGGAKSKKNIVAQVGSSPPQAASPEDISMFLWAIKDPAATEHFAEMGVDAKLEWLPYLSEHLAPSPNASFVPIVSHSNYSESPPPLLPVTKLLGNWLRAHAHDPNLLTWITEKGPFLHPHFALLIRIRLEKEARENGSILNPIPDAVKKIWRVLLMPELLHVNRWVDHSLSDLPQRLENEDESETLRLHFIEALQPGLSLQRPLRFPDFSSKDDDDEAPNSNETRISNIIHVDCELRAENMSRTIAEAVDKRDDTFLGDLAFDLTHLLRRALDLFGMLDQANDEYDPSVYAQASVAPHPQNSHMYSWTWLIDLARASFDALYELDPDRASALIQLWRSISYPTFRRLTYYGTLKLLS